MIKLIVAIANNGLIGNNDKMPWHIPEEFKHFKETTMDHALLFGRTTFEGLPNKLPGRKNIVLSSKEVKGADKVIHSEEELYSLFNEYKDSNDILFIAGGKTVYEKYYKFADELIISEVKGIQKGNVFLQLDISNWKKELIKTDVEFDVYSYRK